MLRTRLRIALPRTFGTRGRIPTRCKSVLALRPEDALDDIAEMVLNAKTDDERKRLLCILRTIQVFA